MPLDVRQSKISKNRDRYVNDESFDLSPTKVQGDFQSANSGVIKRQARLANELTEKDPAIAQAWQVRVSAIASCPWEIVGGVEEEANFINKSLRTIQPAYDTGLSSFNQLLQSMQSAVMQGFSIGQTEWSAGGSRIDGFRIFAQSLFSYVNSDLPYFVGKGADGVTTGETITPSYPKWIYHTSTNSRSTEPLRSGIVRPLAYLYSFRRHIRIEYLSGLEKYGYPQPFVGVDGALYDDDNTDKQKLEEMLQNWTYNGYSLFDKDVMEVTFPTADSGFDVNNFLSYLDWTEKQIFRIILGQDSTSSADNSNRSTAQVHNLVRGDMLASDAKAVEETVNNQIIKPLYEATYGHSDSRPVFRFRLKGVTELQEMANVVKTLDEAGYETDEQTLSERFGFKITKKESEEQLDEDGQNVN
jgi:phage gp29-like protein